MEPSRADAGWLPVCLFRRAWHESAKLASLADATHEVQMADAEPVDAAAGLHTFPMWVER